MAEPQMAAALAELGALYQTVACLSDKNGARVVRLRHRTLSRDLILRQDSSAGAKITALQRTDLDSTIPTGLGLSPLNVSYERRTRNENDITYYDIFIYFYTD